MPSSNRNTETNWRWNIFMLTKGHFTPKWKFYHHLLTHYLLQICMSTHTHIYIYIYIYEECWQSKLTVAIDFHSIFFMATVRISYFLQIRSKKLIPVWSNSGMSKWWQNLHFLDNFFFKFGKQLKKKQEVTNFLCTTFFLQQILPVKT